jgi:hypothetical protein
MESTFAHPFPSQVSFARNTTTSTARTAKGISFHTVDFCTRSVLIIADIPRIKRIFTIFDPTIFPMAISVLPLRAALIFTISSGADVPNATIVRPITIGGIQAFLEREPAPLMRISHP